MLKLSLITQCLIAAICLTFLSSCALFGHSEEKADENLTTDPIARAARLDGFGTLNRGQEEFLFQHRNREEYEVQKGLAVGELVVGMSMNEVVSIWGRPRDVETAGNVRQGNQKWTYLDGFSSPSSLSSKMHIGSSAKVVYFESGRVIGWETNN